jgi:hypothetical protein
MASERQTPNAVELFRMPSGVDESLHDPRIGISRRSAYRRRHRPQGFQPVIRHRPRRTEPEREYAEALKKARRSVRQDRRWLSSRQANHDHLRFQVAGEHRRLLCKSSNGFGARLVGIH